MAGGGRVEDHEVVGAARRACGASSCASSQTLPTVSSSRIPGVAAAKYANRRDAASRSASGRAGSWSTRYSSSADSGSIEMWCRPRASSPSASSCRRARGRARARRRRARRPRPRSSAARGARPRAPSAAATVVLPDAALPRDDEQVLAEAGRRRGRQTSPSQ